MGMKHFMSNVTLKLRAAAVDTASGLTNVISEKKLKVGDGVKCFKSFFPLLSVPAV